MNNLKRIIGLIMAIFLCACNKETGEKQTDIEMQTTGLQEVSELGSDISTENYFPGVFDIPEESTEESATFDTVNFGTSGGVNLYRNGIPLGYSLASEYDDELKLTLQVNHSSDLPHDAEIMRVFVFEDGSFIPFSMDGSEHDLFHELSIRPGREEHAELSFRLPKDFRFFTILCINYDDENDYPDDLSMGMTVFNENYMDTDIDTENRVFDTDYYAREESGISSIYKDYLVKRTNAVEGYGFSDSRVDPESSFIAQQRINPYFNGLQVGKDDPVYLEFCDYRNGPSYYVIMFRDRLPVKLHDDYGIFVRMEEGAQCLFEYPVTDFVTQGKHDYHVAVIMLNYVKDSGSQALSGAGVNISGAIPIERQ